jgi:peptide-methionine (S)-S-oxide reductase
MNDNPTSEAIFGGGCFWCLEAVFLRISGVKSVKSGYAGGSTENPTYDAVCSGTTGHAEVVKIEYDPTKITYQELLAWFFRCHDPTTLNRQGADVGSQYRSIVLYQALVEKAAVATAIKAAQSLFPDPIVTESQPLGQFYAAEAYHENYYATHQAQGYCRMVITPKLSKLGFV